MAVHPRMRAALRLVNSRYGWLGALVGAVALALGVWSDATSVFGFGEKPATTGEVVEAITERDDARTSAIVEALSARVEASVRAELDVTAESLKSEMRASVAALQNEQRTIAAQALDALAAGDAGKAELILRALLQEGVAGSRSGVGTPTSGGTPLDPGTIAAAARLSALLDPDHARGDIAVAIRKEPDNAAALAPSLARAILAAGPSASPCRTLDQYGDAADPEIARALASCPGLD